MIFLHAKCVCARAHVGAPFVFSLKGCLGKTAQIFFALVLFCAFTIFTSCKNESNTVHLWTNQKEFASYAESFNASQDTYRVIVEYKQSPVEALAKLENSKNASLPDIIVGPWLKNETVRKNFASLNSLFAKDADQDTSNKLYTSDFYPKLLELGNINGAQYLLPVSFNLPLIIFDQKNSSYVQDSFQISVEKLRIVASQFNERAKNGTYTAMGFSALWDEDFMYVVSKLFGANYAESGELFSYDEKALNTAIYFLKDWSAKQNSSTEAEDDFKFKYLYSPVQNLVSTDRCLFGYTKSDVFFALPQERIQNIDFRWLCNSSQTEIAVADKMIYMGRYKKSPNKKAADAFMLWFLNETTQQKLLARSFDLQLTAQSFGISGGFSSLVLVNERAFPLYYPSLFGHLPKANMLSVPNILPEKWEDIKEKVIIPYIAESVRANIGDASGTSDAGTSGTGGTSASAGAKTVKSLTARISEWQKAN